MRILVTGSRNFAERYNNFLKAHPYGFVNSATIDINRLDSDDKQKLCHKFRQAVRRAIADCYSEITFVHGDCPTGVDRICSEFVELESEIRLYKEIVVKQEKHPADWKHLGRMAGPTRNSNMVNIGFYNHAIVAWDGSTEGSGTFDCFRKLTLAGIDAINVTATRA